MSHFTKMRICAMSGDSAQARRDAEWLASLSRRYLLGSNTRYRAAITGALGERDEGVSLLREAYSEGYPHWWAHSWNSDFSPLRDHPDFQELMRPKG